MGKNTCSSSDLSSNAQHNTTAECGRGCGQEEFWGLLAAGLAPGSVTPYLNGLGW